MSPSQDLPHEHEQANQPASAYAAAADSCGGPQLLPFVRFNDSHLPSAFPSSFLAVHAAFCIKDGEAPQIPDYLLTGHETLTAIGEAAALCQPVAPRVLVVGSDAEQAQDTSSGTLFTWGTKSFQFKALRRALDFQWPGGPDFKSLRIPIVEQLLHLSPRHVSSQRDCPLADSTALRGGNKSQEEQQAKDTFCGSPVNPLVSDLEGTEPSGKVSSSLAGTSASQIKDETENSKQCQGWDNPLLQETPKVGVQDSVSDSQNVLPGKPCDSGFSSAKRRRGLNTAAMRHKNLEQVSVECKGNNLCLSQAACAECLFENCGKEHDVGEFMKTRPEDLEGECVFFSRHGFCPYGCCCRFGRSHVDPSGINLLSGGTPATASDLRRYQEARNSEELNALQDHCKTLFALRHRRRSRSNMPSEVIQSAPEVDVSDRAGGAAIQAVPSAGPDASTCLSTVEPNENPGPSRRLGTVGIVSDDLDPEARRRRFAAQVRGKAFLAPLTTVGNLPFRRLCTRLGADVTVSEMAVANSLIEGKPSELSLLRRHHTESIFGIQVAAGFPDVARDCGKLIHDLNISCDFIDLNIACPLDQLHRRFKAGSCMLEKPAVVESVVKSLMEANPSIPVTLKVRTAHYGKKHQLHSSIKRLASSGVAAIFAHGRTAQQRYSKSADWNYLSRCRELMPEDVLLVGCGDIFSSAEFMYREETAGLDALMIGRGALIKPWIFTEIKEKRLWDISASERLSLIKEFVDNGLEHWGSDRRGVATTRRFLLELLSFMHRYIPPPFLELQPQLIHWRPSPFKGRSDLEIKLSSPNSQDWVEISSMFLGPPPKGFTFVPKHASNAYYVAE